jgi:hypothetical protein
MNELTNVIGFDDKPIRVTIQKGERYRFGASMIPGSELRVICDGVFWAAIRNTSDKIDSMSDYFDATQDGFIELAFKGSMWALFVELVKTKEGLHENLYSVI